METSQKVFWGIVALAALSLFTSDPLLSGNGAAARFLPPSAVGQQGAGGGACQMGGGGGCGCGGGAVQP